LVNIYLLYYAKKNVNQSRFGVSPLAFDYDLVGLILELRLSIYGGRREFEIRNFLTRNKRMPKIEGMMSFYCLIEDLEILKSLDGWMVATVRRAMQKRNEMILRRTKGLCSCPTPSKQEIISGDWFNRRSWPTASKNLELEMPSFVRGWSAARKHFHSFGFKGVVSPPVSSGFRIDDMFDRDSY